MKISTANGMVGMVLQHAGSELSYQLSVKSSRKMQLDLPDGTKKIIQTIGKSPIDMCCPSIEGTFIAVFFKNKTEGVYEVATGLPIGNEFMAEVKKGRRRLPRFYN